MGGHVSVVIKHKNEFKSVESYTGSYQSLLYSTESLNNELEASIDKYVSNKEEGVCAPVGYGLVFFDFDKKEIHTLQDYDLAGTFMASDIFMRHARFIIMDKINPLEEFILQDKVDVILDGEYKTLQDFFQIENKEIIVNLLKIGEDIKIKDKEIPFIFINFIIKDWKVFTYEKQPESLIQLFEVVKNGVKESDLKYWDNELEEFMDYYELKEDISNLSNEQQDKIYENLFLQFKSNFKLNNTKKLKN